MNDFDAIVERRSWSAGALGIASLVLTSVSSIALGVGFEPALGWVGVIVGGIGAFVYGTLWHRFMGSTRSLERVHVEGNTVHAGTAKLSGITRGDAAQNIDGSWRVDLHAPLRPRLRLSVPTAEHARSLLGTLNVDRRQGTSHLLARWARPAHGVEMLTPMILMLTWCAFSSINHTMQFSWMIFFSGFVYAAIRNLVTRAKVTVGADGVHVDRGVFGKRFIAHNAILDVGKTAKGLDIVTTDEKTIPLHTWRERERTGNWLTDPVFDAVWGAWNQSRYLRNAGGGALAALARGGRRTSDWIKALREIGARDQGGYRTIPIEDRELLAILADAQAPAELRAAAAVALGTNPEHAPKLRIAADEVADPVVRRVALATSDSELALEQALEEATAPPSLRAQQVR